MSAKHAHIEGRWEDHKNRISLRVPLIVFEEDKCQIVYCPPLDIYGYGTDEKEAFKSFNICLGEFLQYSTNKGTLFNELGRLGWKVLKSKKKAIIPPSMSKLLSENENFSRIFDNFSFRKLEQEISIPA